MRKEKKLKLFYIVLSSPMDQTFPASAREEQATARKSFCNIMMQGRQQQYEQQQ
jgi:hypothetical protein